MKKGYGVTETGLTPVYPEEYDCSPLTSLYASWLDIDGTKRDERHSGVDGGRLGEWILAPASGTVRAAWRSNWQWGWEGSLLISHTREEINLEGGAPIYYSAFDHLTFDEIKHFKTGQKISRGQRLARVARPGGNPDFGPEVHWEVWEVWADRLTWKKNKYNAPVWHNKSASLIDPLYMLGLNRPNRKSLNAQITPYDDCKDYKDCVGYTYILPCKKK